MFVLPTVADFIFMATESVFIDAPSCISTIVEMHPDVLVDLLVVLAVMFSAVASSSTLEGLPVVTVLVSEATWVAIGSWHG